VNPVAAALARVEAGDTMAAHAVCYASRGWAVLPVAPGHKRALIYRWQQQATSDLTQVCAWWTHHPGANIGVHCGPASGLICIDLDGRDAIAAWEDLQRRHRGIGDGHLWTRTCRDDGGWHLWLRWDHPWWPQSTDGLGPGIEVRAEGRQTLVPPSLHPSGRRYEWHTRHAPRRPPSWLVEYLRRDPPAYEQPLRRRPPLSDRAVAGIVRTVSTAHQGNRNATLFWGARKLARHVTRGDLTEHEATALLLDAAHQSGHVPGHTGLNTDKTAAATIASGLRRGYQDPDLERS
jgi:hypothetical protein